MSNLPRFSIVTCSLNQRRFLEASIQSVLSQDYPALEYIIVDGGSTDGSREVIERYQRRLSWWVCEPDEGQTDALIKGFSRATGQILGWLCSDDLLVPGTLRRVAELFAGNEDLQVLFGDAVWIDEGSRYLGYKKEIPFHRFIWLWSHNYLPQPSTFWRRELYARAGGLDPGYELAMDGDLWERFSRLAAIAHVPRVFSLIRRYPDQKNMQLRKQSDLEDRRYRLRALQRPPRPLEMPLKSLAARVARVGLKILRGCYARSAPREVMRFIQTVRKTR